MADSPKHVVLISGDDDVAVKKRAKALFDQWSNELGGMDHEIIDAAVGNAGEALKVIGRLKESLQTLPFFGTGKAVWLKDCSFLAEDRTSSSAAVGEGLTQKTRWAVVVGRAQPRRHRARLAAQERATAALAIHVRRAEAVRRDRVAVVS